MQRYNNKLLKLNSQEDQSIRKDAAQSLLKVGAPVELVQSLVGDDLPVCDLEQPDNNQKINDNPYQMMEQSPIVDQQLKKETDDYFDRILKSLDETNFDDFTDPITLSIMKDPVIISSGHVFDRSSVYQDGKMNFKNCPISRKPLKEDAYPVVFLKRQINEWLIGRFDYAIQITKVYMNQEEKFNKLCDRIENIIEYLGEDIYTRQSMVYAQMLLDSPYHQKSPQNTQKILERIYNHIRHNHEKARDFQHKHIQPIINRFYQLLNRNEIEDAWQWFNVCEQLENRFQDLKDFIQLDMMRLEIAKSQGSDKKTIVGLQQQIYYDLIDQQKLELAKQFLEEQDLDINDLEDHKPVVTKVGTKSMNNWSDEFLQIQELNKIKFNRVGKIFIKADWGDQGWGNKKGALGLELVRGNDVIAFQNIFGTYNRGNDQKECTLNRTHGVVSNFLAGDKYILKGRVGGGGGHRLEIKKVEITVKSQGDMS